MHLGYDLNKYGVRFSRHTCDVCGVGYTVTPARGPGEAETCTVLPCPSYDPELDPVGPDGTPRGMLVTSGLPPRGEPS